MVVFSVTVPADSQAADWLSWPLKPWAKQCNVQEQPVHWVHWAVLWKEGEITTCSVAHVLVPFNLCSTDVTGGTHCTCMYFTHQTRCCTKIRKSTLFILVLESTCTAYIHPIVHVPAPRCLHEASANCTPTHPHTQTSLTPTRGECTLITPPHHRVLLGFLQIWELRLEQVS